MLITQALYSVYSLSDQHAVMHSILRTSSNYNSHRAADDDACSGQILTGDMLQAVPIFAQASTTGSGMPPQGALKALVMIAERRNFADRRLLMSDAAKEPCRCSFRFFQAMLHCRFVGCQLPTAAMEMGLYQQSFPTSGHLA